MNYANMNVDELKAQMKIHNLMQYSTMRKDELITSLNKIETYLQNSKNCDYRTFNFGDKQIVVNDEQYAVITSKIEQHSSTLASAGSGKSSTMVCRIKYLVDHGVHPKAIMLTCFNVAAAQSIKDKINALFNFNIAITVGTFDSIAVKFFHQYFKQDYHIGINEYASLLLKFLRSPNGTMISSAYSHIFFDEFQDINQTQFEILQEYAKSGAYIISIGDNCQNIYSFRNSNVEYILNFDKYFKGAATYKLVNNLSRESRYAAEGFEYFSKKARAIGLITGRPLNI
jgi:superfamily I DNA/RNA helicase